MTRPLDTPPDASATEIRNSQQPQTHRSGDYPRSSPRGSRCCARTAADAAATVADLTALARPSVPDTPWEDVGAVPCDRGGLHFRSQLGVVLSRAKCLALPEVIVSEVRQDRQVSVEIRAARRSGAVRKTLRETIQVRSMLPQVGPLH